MISAKMTLPPVATRNASGVISVLGTLPCRPLPSPRWEGLSSQEPRTAAELFPAIQAEPELEAKILAVLDYSPEEGGPRGFDLMEALAFLHPRHLDLLITSLASISLHFEGMGIHASPSWEHSLGTAFAARSLAARIGYPNPEVAFAAGLLHDVGKTAICAQCPAEFREVISRTQEEGVEPQSVERELLGFDHAEVGALLGLKWNVPGPVTEAIRDHHSPGTPWRPTYLVDLLRIADRLAHHQGIGWCLGAGGDPLKGTRAEEMGLTKGLLPEIECRFAEAYHSRRDLFS